MLEIGAHDQLKTLVKRDYEQFSGVILERYFHAQLVESRRYTRLGSWWDRMGENEIDIIAENELEKTVSFFEVKRDIRRYSRRDLELKAEAFMRATGAYGDYAVDFGCLSMADI